MFYLEYEKNISEDRKRNCSRNKRLPRIGGFEVLGIMGIAGSPSCGVTRALDIRKSFEFLANTNMDGLDRERMNELGVRELIIEGKGFFIEAIDKELKKKKINVRFYEHDLSSEIKGEEVKIELSQG
ncbi:MAG: hypothetical protein H6Q41_5215 [Deltaproteobacteria bacterium]|nr:hypothetical protein [Deltaproteobacteria bacterium]